MRRVLFLGFALALVAQVGCAVPEPRGATRSSEHYEVRTDTLPGPFAEEVATTAERAHATLAAAYGDAPGGSFPVVVYRQRAAFDEQLSPALKDKGFVGECGERFALVYWPDVVRGEDTLAHELVHHFNAALLPGIPYWVDEGLAKALAPKRVYGDWLAAVAELRDDELRAHVRSLAALPEGDDYALRCLVAAAVIRFGLDTENFADLRGIRSWRCDTEAFLRWLRMQNCKRHQKFAPVWDTTTIDTNLTRHIPPPRVGSALGAGH